MGFPPELLGLMGLELDELSDVPDVSSPEGVTPVDEFPGPRLGDELPDPFPPLIVVPPDPLLEFSPVLPLEPPLLPEVVVSVDKLFGVVEELLLHTHSQCEFSIFV